MVVYNTMVQAMIVRKIKVIANDEQEAALKAEQIFRNDVSDGVTHLALVVEGGAEGPQSKRHQDEISEPFEERHESEDGV
jgi:hypothetical protein